MLKRLFNWVKEFLFSKESSFLKKIFRGGTWLSLGLVLTNLLGLIKAAVMVRFLKPEDFGLMGIAFVTLRWLEVLSESGFNAALIHKKGDITPYLDSAWVIQICRGVLLALLLFLSGNMIAMFVFSNEQAGRIIQASGIIVFFKSFVNPAVIQLKKRLDLKAEFYWRLSGAMAGFITGVVAAVLLKNVWALVISVIASQAVVALVSFLVYPFKPRLKFSYSKAKELYRYGRSIFLTNLFTFFREWADSLIVVKVCGLTSLGFYQISRQFSYDPSIQFGMGIRGVMFPAFAMLKNKADIAVTYFRSMKYLTSIMLPSAIVVTIYAKMIVGILFGSDWLSAVSTLTWLVWASIGVVFNGINHSCLAGIGKPQHAAIANGVSMLCLMIFFLPAFRALQETGMAITIAITLLVSYAAQVIIILRYLETGVSGFILSHGLSVVCTIPFVLLMIIQPRLTDGLQVFFLVAAFLWMLLCIVLTIKKDLRLRKKEIQHDA